MLELHLDYLAVRFRPGLDARAKRAVARECHLMSYQRAFELPGERFALMPVAETAEPRDRRHARAVAGLRRHRHVERVGLVWQHRKMLVIATDRLWVGTRAGSRAALRALERRGARVLIEREGECLLQLRSDAAPEVVARRLARLASVEYAEPDHVLIGRGLGGMNGARLAVGQPAMRAIEAPGAWRAVKIGPSVVVAIIDCGVLADHEDLVGAVTARFDTTGKGNPGRPAPWDNHGTECAALVGGTHRVSQGVKGVAAGCGIAAVRVGYTPSRLGNYLTKVSWLVSGIEWAWRQGAAVLSMSFGGGPPSTPVARALDRARSRGRDGKGCVLVAAAGNSGIAGVEFPASHDGVVGVAALDQSGRPASFSNRGPEVDLAAPGVNIYTATIPDPTEGETARYCQDSGTSLAAPLVAAAAALVIAVNPSLGEKDVRQVLATTAGRVPGQTVIDGRNDRVGAGRLAVARALRRARRPR